MLEFVEQDRLPRLALSWQLPKPVVAVTPECKVVTTRQGAFQVCQVNRTLIVRFVR